MNILTISIELLRAGTLSLQGIKTFENYVISNKADQSAFAVHAIDCVDAHSQHR